MYRVEFIFLIFGFVSFSFLSHLKGSLIKEGTSSQLKSITVNEDTLTTSLHCIDSLRNQSAHIDRMFFQFEKILDKIEVTKTNKDMISFIKNKVYNWKKGQKDFRIKTLLQIFYFFNIAPSIALTSNSLEKHIDFDRLKSKAYPSEENVQKLLILINRYLRSQIEEFQTEFALDLGVDNITLLELSKIMGVPYIILINIRRYNSVPTYLQMKKLLNVGSSIIMFFEELESFEDFKTLFAKNNQLGEGFTEENSQNLGLEESQILSNQGRRIIKIVFERGLKYRSIKSLIGFQKDQIESGQINFFVTLLFKTSYVTGYPVSYLIGDEYLADDFELPDLNLENNTNKKDYIDKSKKILIYLIKHEMIHQGLSIQQLAIKTNLTKRYLRKLFKRNENINLKYLNLLKIVEKGFNIKLQDFFNGKNSTGLVFEELINQFEAIDFDILKDDMTNNDENDDIVSYYTEDMTKKLSKLLEILKANYKGDIEELIGGYRDYGNENKIYSIRISKLLRITYIFNITLLDLLF